MGYSSIIGVQHLVQPMIVRSTYRITWLHCTYRCATLGGDYLCKLYLKDHWLALDVWVANLTSSLTWLPPPTESLGYTTCMGVQL